MTVCAAGQWRADCVACSDAYEPNETRQTARLVAPDALIRAYVYLSDSGYTPKPADAKSVLQIAETRAQSDGSFTLLLPSHLN